MTVTKFYVIMLCLLVYLCACQKDSSNEVTVETIEGVEYVHNPGTPLHPGRTVSFIEELVIKSEDESGEIRLYQPGSFTVDANHRVYVSDLADQTIKVFDQNGVYLNTIGAKGKGPGEFLQILELTILPDGKLLVMDMGNRRTSLFSQEGQHLLSCKWPTFLSRVYLTTDSSFTCEEMDYTAQERKQLVKTFDFSCNELVSYGEFTPIGISIKRQKKVAFGIPKPYSPHSIFAGDQQRQLLFHCLNSEYVIEVYDRLGKLLRKIDRPYEPLPFTDEDAQKILARFEESDNPVFAQMAKEVQFPDVKTAVARLVVDDTGNLWIATNESREVKTKTETAYDIFDPDGVYVAKIWLTVRPRLFLDGKAYSLVRDSETELTAIKRYRIVWGNEGS